MGGHRQGGRPLLVQRESRDGIVACCVAGFTVTAQPRDYSLGLAGCQHRSASANFEYAIAVNQVTANKPTIARPALFRSMPLIQVVTGSVGCQTRTAPRPDKSATVV
jgi:hypothetical protein